MDRGFFESNRKDLLNRLDDNSICVFFAGEAPVKRGDERYPFVPESNFYYFTGIDREKIIAVFIKKGNEREEKLFIERHDEVKAKWVGERIGKEECRKKSGIEKISYTDEFEEDLASDIFNKRIENIYINLENRYFDGRDECHAFAEKIKKEYPAVKIKNLYYIAAEMRTVKKEEEIQNIKKAAEITKEGIYAMMKNAKPDMMEYEIEAYFDFELKKRGVREKAFATIAAGGKNAAILHYSDNNCRVKNGELILFDVGAKFGYYSADITRTFPVNGKFTQRQRQIYDIVLEGQKKVKEAIRPGVMFKSLNEILKDFYFQELKKIGLAERKEDVRKYYYHGVSHLLGLETHDAGRHNEGVLKEGMVLTVEPGLYIEEEGIGIRIEDDVVVRENGCEVISEDIIRSAEEIEKFMAE